MKPRYWLFIFFACVFVSNCKDDSEPVHANVPSTHIVFEAEDDIFIMTSDGEDLKRLTSSNWNTYPRWSPDGQRIAYYSKPSGIGFGLYVMWADSTHKERITDVGAPNQIVPIMFEWCPSGEYIVYVSPNYELVVVNMMTREKRTITGPLAALPHWSPDGSSILFSYYVQSDSTNKAHIINRDGSGLRALAPHLYRSAPSDWSKRTNEILIAGVRDSAFLAPSYVFAIRPDGSGLRQLTSDERPGTGGVYSPDGSTILFWSTRDGTPELYSMKADGSLQTRLTHLGLPGLAKWLPSGEAIIYLTVIPNSPMTFTLHKINPARGTIVALRDSVGFGFDISPQ